MGTAHSTILDKIRLSSTMRDLKYFKLYKDEDCLDFYKDWYAGISRENVFYIECRTYEGWMSQKYEIINNDDQHLEIKGYMINGDKYHINFNVCDCGIIGDLFITMINGDHHGLKFFIKIRK